MNRSQRRKHKKKVRKRGLNVDCDDARLTEAASLQKQGDIENSHALYEAILADDPKNFTAWHLCGLCDMQMGNLDAAITRISKALKIRPRYPVALNNLGLALHAAGRTEEAAATFRKALRFQSDFADAYHNLGNAHLDLAEYKDAAANYQTALRHRSDFPEVHYSLGNLYREQGRLGDAIIAYDRAVKLRPLFLEALINLGATEMLTGQIAEARSHLRQALAIDPNNPEILSNLGMTLILSGAAEEAIEVLQRAVQLEPKKLSAHASLAGALQKEGRRDDAIRHFRICTELAPRDPGQLYNLGTHLMGNGDIKDASVHLELALQLDPDHALTRNALGMLQLTQGDWAAGWANYLYRREVPDATVQRRKALGTLWNGEVLDGKSIYLWGDQGLGEHLLFSSLLPPLIDRAAKVAVECENRLLSLFQRSFPMVNFQSFEDAKASPNVSDSFDFYSCLSDIGPWLRPTPETAPTVAPYLVADERATQRLRESYCGLSHPVVGVSWYSKNVDYGFKSMPLEDLTPILSTPEVTFVDLQYGDTTTERTSLTDKTGITLIHDDDVDQMLDVDLFASQVAAMDMVVSISNTTAHLACALGVPTLLMLDAAPIWYWSRTGSQSLWYTTAELFRQTRRGVWADVIKAVANVFGDRLAQHRRD